MSDDADPLISIEEVSVRWRTTISAIAPMVADGSIASLDGGRLAAARRTNIPVLRASWAEAARVDSPGAVRRIDLDNVGTIHPAATVALDFHEALSANDAEAVWRLSSGATRGKHERPAAMLDAWRAALGDLTNDTGITTGVYALVPRRGVGVRLVARTGPLPTVYDKPTPVAARGIFVLVRESNEWRVDLELTTADVNYLEFLRSAPPPEWTVEEGPLD